MEGRGRPRWPPARREPCLRAARHPAGGPGHGHGWASPRSGRRGERAAILGLDPAATAGNDAAAFAAATGDTTGSRASRSPQHPKGDAQGGHVPVLAEKYKAEGKADLALQHFAMAAEELTKGTRDTRPPDKVFRYSSDAHILARRIQKPARKLFNTRVRAATLIEAAFRGFQVRYEVVLRHRRLGWMQRKIARAYRKHLAKMQWARALLRRIEREDRAHAVDGEVEGAAAGDAGENVFRIKVAMSGALEAVQVRQRLPARRTGAAPPRWARAEIGAVHGAMYRRRHLRASHPRASAARTPPCCGRPAWRRNGAARPREGQGQQAVELACSGRGTTSSRPRASGRSGRPSRR